MKRIGRLYEKVLSLRKDDDYVVCQEQMEKLLKLYDFFLRKADECDKVDGLDLHPKEEHGDVTAYFLVFSVHGKEVLEFSEVIRACSAIGIDVSDDMVCISCTIPGVFKHK